MQSNVRSRMAKVGQDEGQEDEKVTFGEDRGV